MLSMNTSSPLSSRRRKKPGVKRYFVTTAHSTGPNNKFCSLFMSALHLP